MSHIVYFVKAIRFIAVCWVFENVERLEHKLESILDKWEEQL